MRNRLIHIVKEAIVIVVVAAGLGVVANAVNPRGIGWIMPPPTSTSPAAAGDTRDGGPVDIDVDAAHRLFTEKSAIFIDARPPVDFAAGHIPGAVNRQGARLDEWMPRFFEQTPPGTTIVTYCSSRSCPLAHHLARQLADIGYTDVRVMADGWQAWQSQGLPTAAGASD